MVQKKVSTEVPMSCTPDWSLQR